MVVGILPLSSHIINARFFFAGGNGVVGAYGRQHADVAAGSGDVG